MNVSLLVMILWLVSCYGSLSSLFKKSQPIKLETGNTYCNKNEAREELALTLAAILLFVISFVLVGIDIWYLSASAAIINNVFFTLFTALLILTKLIGLGKVIHLGIKISNKETIDTGRKRIRILGVIKVLHLAYFGYFIFTGISLFEVLLI